MYYLSALAQKSASFFTFTSQRISPILFIYLFYISDLIFLSSSAGFFSLPLISQPQLPLTLPLGLIIQ